LALPASAAAVAPANDNFAAALLLLGDTATASVNNTDATRETGEPAHAEAPNDASVWWQWTATQTRTIARARRSPRRRITIDTCDSDFDTVLGVYTGTDVANLAGVAASDDSCSGVGRSRVSFAATSGVTYKIAVAGFLFSDGVDVGNIELAITAPAAPVNDNFANATTIVGGPTLGSNIGASAQLGEPRIGGPTAGGVTTWWTWTPPTSGEASVSTCRPETTFFTLIGVFTGPAWTRRPTS